MTLDDFITLTEMKDGLTALAHVKELLAVMQKEKDGLVKNAGDATRQWAAVASTIVATENKECLDLFIQLDGLWFIDRWLKDVQTFKNEASDCLVEEAISSMLQAVEKLQLDSERLVSSGICITVKSLLNDRSAKVQGMARALVDSWKAKDVDTKCVDVENAASCDVMKQISEHSGSQSSATYVPAVRPYVGGAEIENNGSAKVQDKANTLCNSWKAEDVDVKSVDVENASCSDVKKQICEHPDSQSTATDTSAVRSHADHTSGGAEIGNAAFHNVMERTSEHPEPQSSVINVPSLRPHVDQTSGAAQIENLKLHNDKDNSCVTPNCANSKDGIPDEVAALVKLDPIVGNLSLSEDLCHSAERVDPTLLAAPKLGSVEVTLEMVKFEHASEETRHDKKLEFCADSFGKFEVPSYDNFGWREVSSGSNAKAAEEVAPKPDEVAHDGIETTSFLDKKLPGNDSTYEMDDGRILEQKHLEQGDDSALEETQEPATILSIMEEVIKGDEVERRHRKSKKKSFGNKFARLGKHSKNTDIIRQSAGMGLEDGTFDAIEVARLVAKEVEREVGDYDEPSGSSASTYSSSSFSSSSSEGHSTGGIRQPNSLDSINGEQEVQLNGPTRDIESFQASKNEAIIGSTNRETNLDNNMQDMESSQVTDAVPDPESHTEKSFLEFDLNQEFSSEDLDHQYVDTISNPVSVVSASRAVVTSGMPAGPLKFEGSLGWKGSAASSAFRPASPRRASDSDKALSGGGTSSDSRQRQDFLDIDLNVAEGGEDKIVSNVSGKQNQVSVLPGLVSGESSVELSSKRSEMLKFDLNQTEKGGGIVASEWTTGGSSFGPQRCRSPSPASSSSCMQPSTRNFDLNDNPSNSNDPSDIYSFLGESSSHKVNSYVRQDDSVSILGTKVKKSSFPSQPLLPFPRTSEPVMDANLIRGGPLMGLGPAVPYPQSVYGYNEVAMSPTISFSSAPMYRPAVLIPYLFDSRGAPFVPQIVGPASTVQSSYCQPSLTINLMGAPPSNVAGPLRPTLDMNAGFAVEAGNRDPGFLRQLYVPGQGRLLDDQLRDGFRPLSAGSSGVKRKEPDSGWELHFQ